MRASIIIIGILLAIAMTVVGILSHPAFGCRQSDEHKKRIEASANYYDGKFSLSQHPWFEPDSTANKIAKEQQISLLDQPIGSIVEF